MRANRKKSPLIGREIIASKDDKRYIVIEVLGINDDGEDGGVARNRQPYIVSACPVIKNGKLILWRSPKMISDYKLTNKKPVEIKCITGKGDQEVRFNCAEVYSD